MYDLLLIETDSYLKKKITQRDFFMLIILRIFMGFLEITMIVSLVIK